MRSPDEFHLARFARGLFLALLGSALAACGAGSANTDVVSAGETGAVQRASASAGRSTNGPAADYPVVIGTPYFVGDTEYVPTDTLNYDHVGYATPEQGAMGYSGAHHTLPLPSYVEVTNLDNGRTILVRLERRGPMTSQHLVALSPAAMVQIGAREETPVRVRRTIPPEEQRFLLRASQPAPPRIDTPPSLLTVLKRRLPASGTAALSAINREQTSVDPAVDPAANPAASPVAARSVPRNEAEAPTRVSPPAPAAPVTASEPQASPAVAAASPQPVADGIFVVQAGAFSSRERAQRVADAIAGTVSPAGRLFRVRTGPFATRGEAEASLANVRRAGYTDARIFTTG